MPKMVDFAVSYAKKFQAVVPSGCWTYKNANGEEVDMWKRPLFDGWTENPLKTEKQVRDFWAKEWNQYRKIPNVGIATGQICGGYIVIDLDRHPERGIDGLEYLREWEHKNGLKLPDDTWTAITGSGGYHLWFHTDKPLQSWANTEIGVDLRAEGGQVVVPPSTHPSGNRYEWEYHPDDYQCAEADAAVMAFLEYCRPAQEAQGRQQKMSVSEVIPEGARNDTLFKLACSLRAQGLPESAIREAIGRTNDELCSPSLPERDIDTIVKSALKYEAGQLFKPERQIENLEPNERTDLDQGRLLSEVFKDRILYSAATDFLVYDGKAWREDAIKAQGFSHKLTDLQLKEARKRLAEARKEYDAAVEYDDTDAAREAHEKLEKANSFRKYVIKQRSKAKIAAALSESRPYITVSTEQLDSFPFILNTPDGEVDLGTGEMKPHDPKDLCTKMTAVSPDGIGADIWNKFLDWITCGDSGLKNYLQEVAGMAAVGKVYTEALIIAYGGGSNGKSTFFNLLARVMGDYSGGISSDVLTTCQNRNKQYELAELRGKRIVIAPELEEGRRLDTGILKRLCSTDPITAERKYRDAFTFIPSHQLILFTNHLPKVGSTDSGTWRRLKVIPFRAKIDKTQDIKDYCGYLFDHCAGAVLSWIIQGAQVFLANGGSIADPECVKAAVTEYRQEADWLGNFIEERCEKDPNTKAQSSTIYAAYTDYCRQYGEYTRAQKDFKAAMEQAGYDSVRLGAGVFYKGLRVRFVYHAGMSSFEEE